MGDGIQVTNNTREQQFEVHADGHLAVLQYRFHEGAIWLMHTEVPDQLGGKGIASALAHYGLEWAKSNGMPVKVICPFVATYLKRHPEYNSILIK